MIETWLSFLGGHGRHLRIRFLDFAKAFDRIGHNVAVAKLLDLGVRRSLIIRWIINFLTNHRHRVKLPEFNSDWLPSSAGVPQGTKLGPILFLVMINNHLNPISNGIDIWKFADDISTSEGSIKDSNSNMQSNLDSIISWSLKLNPKKTKEMRISFQHDNPDFHQVPGHFAERHFAERHFAERIFCRRTLCRTNILSNGQCDERTFRRKDILPKRQLAENREILGVASHFSKMCSSQSLCNYKITIVHIPVHNRSLLGDFPSWKNMTADKRLFY